jgi:hypothetical protein
MDIDQHGVVLRVGCKAVARIYKILFEHKLKICSYAFQATIKPAFDIGWPRNPPSPEINNE